MFTPGDVDALDTADADFGAGGVLLVPGHGGGSPPLAAAAGKAGILYLLNRSALGGYHPGGPNQVIDSAVVGRCWCGQSYYEAGGDARIVSSGGNQVNVWSVQTSPTVALVHRRASLTLPNQNDPGFFTTVSSNGQHDAVIWAVPRPADPGDVSLYALQYSDSSPVLIILYQTANAGHWETPNNNADAGIVPVVAGGRVYVASYRQLRIFGLH
jgi:hypothetical protein